MTFQNYNCNERNHIFFHKKIILKDVFYASECTDVYLKNMKFNEGKQKKIISSYLVTRISFIGLIASNLIAQSNYHLKII